MKLVDPYSYIFSKQLKNPEDLKLKNLVTYNACYLSQYPSILVSFSEKGYMEQDQEINLYQRVKGDDRRALTQLFTSYYSSLCNFALPIVKQPELAEELVADVFFVLWRDRQHLDITYSVKAYLFRSVRNRAIRMVSGKNTIHEEIENHSTPMVLNRTPESDYLYKELSTAYQKAYDSLPTRCKQVFKLSKIDGLKYQEISYVLNISVKTVENQMFKALKIIRQAVANYRMEKLP